VIHEGQIVLFRFPQTNRDVGKLRPALVLRKLPGRYDDWLICMISSQLTQTVPGFDEVVSFTDPDFAVSGLKTESTIRISRLAVVDKFILCGAIGTIAPERLSRIKTGLANWIAGREF